MRQERDSLYNLLGLGALTPPILILVLSSTRLTSVLISCPSGPASAELTASRPTPNIPLNAILILGLSRVVRLHSTTLSNILIEAWVAASYDDRCEFLNARSVPPDTEPSSGPSPSVKLSMTLFRVDRTCNVCVGNNDPSPDPILVDSGIHR